MYFYARRAKSIETQLLYHGRRRNKKAHRIYFLSAEAVFENTIEILNQERRNVYGLQYLRDIHIFEDISDRSRLPLHFLYHFLPITEKPAQKAGFSASTPRLQETLEDFWYNHLHNKD
jgi:hypothetical protein